MKPPNNTEFVQGLYAAFGRGDIKTLLDGLADNVDWEAVIGVGPNVPTGGRRVGRAQVQQFFEQLGQNVEFKRFEPREFIAERDRVVVLGFYEGVAKKTGRAIKSEWVMVYKITNGKIAHFREFADSRGITAAF